MKTSKAICVCVGLVACVAVLWAPVSIDTKQGAIGVVALVTVAVAAFG